MVKVSVVMPVYNTEKFVGASIESILGQTFEDFEFIIIDDGSKDNSYAVCQSYAQQDKRIKLLQNKKNQGISYTRNKLLSLAKTNYIVSQDSDDISEPKRIELEYDFLFKHPEYAVVGSDTIIIDEKNKQIGYRKYSNNISSLILKKSPIAQPASMFRKDIFDQVGGYDKKLNYGEDYDLWLKMYSAGYKIMNLSHYLFRLRIRDGQTKSDKLKETIRNTLFIQKRAIKEYQISPHFSDHCYHFLEKCLLFLPAGFVLWLFKLLEYRNEK